MSVLKRAWALLSGLPIGMPIDAFVLAYAAFTITANGVVVAGGNAHTLGAAALGCIGLLAVGGVWAARNVSLRAAYLADLAAEPVSPARARIPASAYGALGLAALALLLWQTQHNAWLAWSTMAAASALLAWSALRSTPAVPTGSATAPETSDYVETAATYVIAALATLVTLVVVRPRSDSTFYLNLAVSVVDFPEQALLSVKNLHGPASATLPPQPMFPPYRVHSFELLGGLLAKATGLSAVQVIHLGLAPVFAWLTPFALRRLLRVVAPRHVVLALSVILSFYCIEGTAARGYSNHALVRMFDGKSALLTVMLPLIFAYGLRFGAQPTRFRFVMLALAQIAGVGLSSTGVWLVPTVAMVAVVAGVPNLRTLPARVAGGLGSSLYVLALGLWVFGQMRAGIREPAEMDSTAEGLELAQQAAAAVLPRFRDLAEAFPIVLGPGRTAIMLLGAALVGTAFAPTVLATRLLSLLVLALVVGFADPWFAHLIAMSVTGVVTYHRIFWLLPVPLAVAFAAVAVHERLRMRFALSRSLPLMAALLLSFYFATVERLVISRENEAMLMFPPAVKLPPVALAAARALCAYAPRGKHVLAPVGVSQQLPTLHDCGFPLLAGDRWLSASASERQTRLAMLGPIDKGLDVSKEQAAWFVAQLRRYSLDAAFLAKESAQNSRVKSLLRLSGFERIGGHEWDQVYAPALLTTRAQEDLVARAVCRLASGPVLAPFGVARALDRTRCVDGVASPATVLQSSGDELDDLLRLERLTVAMTELSATQQAWTRAALERHRVSMVVLGPAVTQSAGIRRVVEGLGMARLKTVQGHLLYTRSDELAAATQ